MDWAGFRSVVTGKRVRAVGLLFAAALVASLVLLAPPLSPAADPGLGEVERVEARSVAPLEGVNGFVFVSVFDATKGAKILGGYLEGTEGFHETVHTTQVWYGGALVKFHYGVECGQEVTVTFHVMYLTPDGVTGEYVKSVTYYC